MGFSSNSDPFPASEFDQWAGQYDEDVAQESFPFTGYRKVLAEIVRLADAQPEMSVLDLGCGTGNLAEQFVALGCELWGTDFSSEMIAGARKKLPSARWVQHDLRQPFPSVLNRRFDRIVSAYVFHHFEMPERAVIIERLWRDLLAPGGRVVIGDISFLTRQALDAVRQAAGDRWDEEPYWVAEEDIPTLAGAGIDVVYAQISDCAGVYRLETAAPHHYQRRA